MSKTKYATISQTLLRKKLVEALRSGEFTRTTGKLFDGESYCCLGVACIVAGKTFKFERRHNEPSFWHTKEEGRFGTDTVMSEAVRHAFGFKTTSGFFGDPDTFENGLAIMNDFGSSFEEIADVIEREPEGLFILPSRRGVKETEEKQK